MLGADIVVNARTDDPHTVMEERTEAYGVDVVVECAGQPGTRQLLLT